MRTDQRPGAPRRRDAIPGAAQAPTGGGAPGERAAAPGGAARRRWSTSALVLTAVLALVVGYAAGSWPGGPAPVPAPTEAEREPEADTGALTWAPPELEDPETVEITEDERDLRLDQERDYLLELPDEPLEAPGGVTVYGGRNVVLIGGEISVAEDDDGGNRGLYLRDQTGTVHVEGLAITGDGLGEGINLDQREGAVVQFQNIYVDTVEGSRDGHHADVIQTWAGPRELRIDRLSGSTTYQGFFLLPMQFDDDAEPDRFDLRRVDIEGRDGSAYLLWRDSASWPMTLTDVWVSPPDPGADTDDFLWPKADGAGTAAWSDVSVGSRPDGPWVPEGLAGVDYESPGYLETTAAGE